MLAHCCIPTEREFFIDNLLARIHFIIVIIGCTGLAPCISSPVTLSGSIFFVEIHGQSQTLNHRHPKSYALKSLIVNTIDTRPSPANLHSKREATTHEQRLRERGGRAVCQRLGGAVFDVLLTATHGAFWKTITLNFGPGPPKS